jgi:hypothetical protein
MCLDRSLAVLAPIGCKNTDTPLLCSKRSQNTTGVEHTSLEYLKKEMAAGRKQIPSSGILIGLLVADMLAYPKQIARVYEVQTLAKAWHTDKLLGIDPDLLNDDRLLRTLSKLGECPSAMRDILQGMTLDVSGQFKISLSRFFVDGSILQLDGAFAQASNGSITSLRH